MSYTPNTPISSNKLSVSAPIMNANFQQLNQTYGIDHYAYTAVDNNGFHKKVTTPSQGTSPLVTTDNPEFYGYVPTNNIGLIQVSQGINAAIPTPVTSLMSPTSPLSLAPTATTNVLDFTGIGTMAIAQLFYMNASGTFAACQADIYWFGSTLTVRIVERTGLLVPQASSSTLQIFNTALSGTTYNDLYWVLKFQRIQ